MVGLEREGLVKESARITRRPATDEEIHASALQFVRKLSGVSKPSKANEAAFTLAVEQVTAAAHLLIDSLQSSAPPRPP